MIAREAELNQVWLHLIVNAAHAIQAKHTDSRGTIIVKSQRTDDRVCVFIQDDGIGIPEEIRHRIFDPFFTTKDVGSGTGQGLALAYSVVVGGHSGTIDFESSTNGSTFKVVLPIVPIENTEESDTEDTNLYMGSNK